MRHFLKKLLPSVAVALTLTGLSLPMSARAQTYPIDCAILLCLSGGWPASVPCARARAEFIRRITPWPVEPPLQIWRCPMGASFETAPALNSADRIFEAFFQNDSTGPRQSFAAREAADPIEAAWRAPVTSGDHVPADRSPRLIQDRADIDISGPEFNFVRTIRVYNVLFARQQITGSDQNCTQSARVDLGTYDSQGGFSWHRFSDSALPPSHIGLEGWGEDCPVINHRSVFVEWRDFSGNYGFEQVNY
ncbi:hypothetical protein [uncultured Roseobacter sp.]|uniref:hypothetical protein n=1 Tax=uncultured Roseobacter sp. TaxID=114847 RepID=UPI0026230EC2|nr:hypothetical protein [uncultured Roseobacter sp.]